MTKSQMKGYKKCQLAVPWQIYLIERNLILLGHVHRMEIDPLRRQLLYSQLKEGKRNQGRPRLRFKNVAKRNFKWRVPGEPWKITELRGEVRPNQMTDIIHPLNDHNSKTHLFRHPNIRSSFPTRDVSANEFYV